MKFQKQLIRLGVSNEKIVLKSIIKDISFNEEDIFNNNITFLFMPLDSLRIAALKKELPKKKIVYPNFSGSGVVANENLQILLDELIIYFRNNPSSSIDIVGHTDNIGNSNDNYNSDLKYAKQVRQYLIRKGNFKASSIKATSKGEAEPIDDNFTKKGRIANKRIEIIFN